MYSKQNRKMVKSFILMYFFGSIIFGIIIKLFLMSSNIEMDNDEFTHVTSILVFMILGIIGIKLYSGLFKYDFKKEKSTDIIIKILVGSLLVSICNLVFSYIFEIISGYAETSNEILVNSVADSEKYIYIFCSIIGITFVPIVEELVFRFILQNWLVSKIKCCDGFLAILLASIVFGFFHAGISYELILYTIMGILLGVIYKKTDNIIIVIFIHAINNFIAVFI